MKIYNQSKTQTLTEYDLEKGYLKPDVLEREISEQEAVEEVFHYEVEKEFPNGGRNMKKVIDVEGKPYIPAHTKREDILIYIPYTEAELEMIAAEREIAELKAKLSKTDYQAIKYAEGFISEVDYAETKALRQSWRDRINELEALIKGGVYEGI